MPTEKEIKVSIRKHSVIPMLSMTFAIIVVSLLNEYFFANDKISPVLIIIFAIAGCSYMFQKVLIDLFVNNDKAANPRIS